MISSVRFHLGFFEVRKNMCKKAKRGCPLGSGQPAFGLV